MMDVDVCPGVWETYYDLASVIRRLTVCFMQLDDTSNSSPSPDVFSLLDDILVLMLLQDKLCFVSVVYFICHVFNVVCTFPSAVMEGHLIIIPAVMLGRVIGLQL